MAKRSRIRVVQKPGATYRVTIPKDMAKKLDLKESDEILWEVHKGHLELYPIEIRPRTGAIKHRREE